MLNSIRVSFKDSIIYGLGNIAVKLIGFILIPLYTSPKYFSVDDFGIITLLDITGLVIISLMASGLPQSLIRWYWDKEYTDNQKGLFFISLIIQIIISLLFCLVLFPFTHQISTIIFGTIDWSAAIKLLILSSALQAVNNIINTLMRVQAKSALFTISNNLKLLVVLGLTIYFIIVKKSGVTGIYLAQVIGNLLFIIFLSVYVIKNCHVFFSKYIFRSMSGYGFPLMLANFAAAALTVIDRYSLSSLAVLKSVAFYSLAYKISSVLKLVIVDSIKLAITPMAMKKMDAPDNKRFYSKTMLYTSYVLMLGIIIISLFSFEIIKLVSSNKEYWHSFFVVPLLSLSVFFVNMRENTIYGLIITKKTGTIGINVVIASILSILLNILFIPKWDITGAALATIISQFVYWVLNYYFSQKQYFIPYELKKAAILFFWGSIISFSGLLLTDMHLVPRLLIKICCLISFPFLLYLSNFYEQVEIKAIKGFIIKWSDLKKLGENLKSLKGIREDI